MVTKNNSFENMRAFSGLCSSSVKLINEVLDCKDSILSLSPVIKEDHLIIYAINENGQVNECINRENYCLFIGEIRNRAKINSILQNNDLALDPESLSDTQKFLKLFLLYGVEAFRIINGSYVSLIYNNCSLFIVSGKMPGEPIYYRATNTFFSFSTQLKTILPHQLEFIPFELLDEKKQYLRPYNTVIKEVYRLTPGSYIEYRFKDHSIIGPTTYYSHLRSVLFFDEKEAICLWQNKNTANGKLKIQQ